MSAFQIVMLVIQGIVALAVNGVWIGILVYYIVDRQRKIKYIERKDRIFSLQKFIKFHYPLSMPQKNHIVTILRKYKISIGELCMTLPDEIKYNVMSELSDKQALAKDDVPEDDKDLYQ